MKKIIILILILFCTTVFAHTINWYVGENIYQTTTCESGDNITPPNAPNKKGYTFQGWHAYVPIEYIESIGTQYIKTGLKFDTTNERLDYHLKISAQVAGSEIDFVSNQQPGSGGFNIGFVGQKLRTYITGMGVSDIDYNADPLELTGYITETAFFNNFMVSERTVNSRPQSSAEIILLAFSSGSMRYYSGRIYFIKLFIDNVLVRDFIPAIDPSNNTPCMYDKVEGKFYYNQGSGQFIAGPVLAE